MPLFLRPRLFALAALAGVVTAGSAAAQATHEQEEACAPDAVRLCAATIPDIPKTTACMKAHVADLSPRCRTVFNEATAPATKVAAAPAPAPTKASREPATRPQTVARASTTDRSARPIRDRQARRDTRAHPAAQEAIASGEPRRSRRTAALPAPRTPAVVNEAATVAVVTPAPALAYRSTIPGLEGVAAQIAADCQAGYIDPFTCRNTFDALKLSE